MQSHYQGFTPPPFSHVDMHAHSHRHKHKYKRNPDRFLIFFFLFNSSLIFKLKIRLEEKVINIFPFFFLFRLLQDLLLSKGQFNRVGELLLSPDASTPPLCVPPRSTSSITAITRRCCVPLKPRNKKKKKKKRI